MNFGHISAALFALSAPLGAQVTARPATPADLAAPADPKRGEFTSPLVLEVPLDRLQAPAPGDLYPFTEQDQIVCEGVSIPLILIRKATVRSGQVQLRIQTSVRVRPSFDRKVVLRHSIVQGPEVVSRGADLELSAEEKKATTGSLTLSLAKEVFDGLFRGDSRGKLKLVMTVSADD